VLLTVSQQLLILDTSTMQVTASCDLLMKQVIHADRFSHRMVNFPAVADAYYSSIKTYKNKVFLLVPPNPQNESAARAKPLMSYSVQRSFQLEVY